MRTCLFSYDQMQLFLGAEDFPEESTNRNSRRAALALLQTAMEQELTDRQRECLRLYYFDRLTMEEIGESLQISKSTVCRHLQKAKRRLRRAAAYAGITAQNLREH